MFFASSEIYRLRVVAPPAKSFLVPRPEKQLPPPKALDWELD
jgi:hypothetical protein